MQEILNRYLRLRVSLEDLTVEDQHLDNDSVTAFVEGNLTFRESEPIVSHLVDCSFCRHVTAELIRLDLAFAENELEIPASVSQPSKVSEVLSGLLARIFGTNENAVFAHQEKNEESDEPVNLDEEKK